MRTDLMCDEKYQGICKNDEYDESKDYLQYKTLAKVPQKILKQYKVKNTDSVRSVSPLDVNPIIKKKPVIKKDMLMGIGIGAIAMFLMFVFLGKEKEQNFGESDMLEVRQDEADELDVYQKDTDTGNATDILEETQIDIDLENPIATSLLMCDREGFEFSDDELCKVLGSEYLRKDITEIRFLNSMASAPVGDYWDVSADASGSVIAWVKSGVEESVPDSEAVVPQVLYIAAEGIIQAPEDCGFLFAGYENVHTIDFNNCFDTSQVKDMGYMFCYCESLPSVDVSRFDTSQVTRMSAMFDGCSSLLSVDVSGFDTSQVTKLGNMFDGCESLTSVDVSGFDTSQVTHMYDMFHGCSSLISVDVSGFDTSQVTDMTGLFMSCTSLTSVDVSGFDTSQVKGMGWMFYGCESLLSVDVSGFDISKVESMIGMFDDNTTPIVGDSGIQP